MEQARQVQQDEAEIAALKKQVMELTLSINDYKRRLSKIEELSRIKKKKAAHEGDGKTMNSQQYFLTTSLSCQLKAARQEWDDFSFIISKQVIGIRVIPVATEYRAVEFYDKKKGRNVHTAFPCGVNDDVNYDESLKAFLFLLNSRCNVSLEKTAKFVSDIRAGALSPSVGMINGMCREFPSKSKHEQDDLFKALLDAPVMHVDGTVARVNGSNNNVVVCSNGTATMYFARGNKGHAGIKDTPMETFGGILIHGHEACFYSYGPDHQECMVHIECYLKDSIENEKNLTWNGQMLTLIQEMIHENNIAPAEGIADEKIREFEARYDA